MSNSSLIFKQVNLAWDEIEKLMQKLDPNQLKVLSPPATQIQIDKLSRSVGLNLPPEIQATLLRHNGCTNDDVFLRYHFYSTENIADKTLAARKKRQTWLQENPGESFPFDEGGWDDTLIMLGTSFAGYELVIEMPDCETAIPTLLEPHNYSMRLATNFVSHLEAFAYHLREGNYINEFDKIAFDHWAERADLNNPR